VSDLLAPVAYQLFPDQCGFMLANIIILLLAA